MPNMNAVRLTVSKENGNIVGVLMFVLETLYTVINSV